MKEIKLTQGYIAIVDGEDYERFSQYKWHYNQGYAVRKPGILMHREINKTKQGCHTDHINGNMLDNRKANLRTCTASQNAMNSKLSKNNKSGFKGVYWRKDTEKWRAKIVINRKTIHLGHYDSRIVAARAYNEAALKYHGNMQN
jgi:hypothetical protein